MGAYACTECFHSFRTRTLKRHNLEHYCINLQIVEGLVRAVGAYACTECFHSFRTRTLKRHNLEHYCINYGFSIVQG